VLGIDPSDAAREGALAAGLATSARFEDALARDDIDAIILCTPHKHHAGQIIAAAQAGKHVFCEKPLCTSANEMEAVAKAVAAAKVQLGIGHERRFEPPVLELGARLTAGELGTGLLMEGSFSQDKFLALPAHNWRLSAEEAPVGPLSATGIHLVDLSIALLGRPTEVWARLATRGSPFANGDTLGVMIAFESGATAIRRNGNAVRRPHRATSRGGWRSACRIPKHLRLGHHGLRRGGSQATHSCRRIRRCATTSRPTLARSRGRCLPDRPRGNCGQRVHLRGHHALHDDRQD
jgi:predicted dehydrogenase